MKIIISCTAHTYNTLFKIFPLSCIFRLHIVEMWDIITRYLPFFVSSHYTSMFSFLGLNWAKSRI